LQARASAHILHNRFSQAPGASELAEKGQRDQKAVGADLIQSNCTAFKCASALANTGAP